NSRNGPMAPVHEAINLMVGDTHERYSIDDSRVYVAGFSGGARVALNWAANGHIAGVIACGAGFGPPGPPKQIPFRIFATTGWEDFNHDEIYRQSRELARRSVPHRFVEFEGGHDWMPAALADEAFASSWEPCLPSLRRPPRRRKSRPRNTTAGWSGFNPAMKASAAR